MAVDIKRRLLQGSLFSVPKLPSKVIRIFMSSTFGDMSAERNVIGEAEPELSQWCRNQGLEFQLVDMRWGVRDEATTDHMTTFLCLQEIKKCQDISLGPNFMFLLGQRYGYRPIPAKILSTEFRVLMEYILEISNLKLVKEWYQLDENSIPAEYVLQSVTADWQSVSSKLADVLRGAAAEAVSAGKLTAEDKKKYFSSVTEQEIEAALEVNDARLHCFGFIREIEDLYDHAEDKDSVSIKYFDAGEDGRPIEEVKLQLNELKNCYLASHLPKENITSMILHWQEPGNVKNTHEYQTYFQTLKNNFVAKVKALTMAALKGQDSSDIAEDPLFLEVIHHADFCVKRCQTFHGCEDTIQLIVDKVCMNADSKPLVIYGPSGSGKSSVMAKVADKMKTEMGESVNVIIRFLGTSSSSSTILQVFQSIVEQICALYNLPLPDHAILNNYDNLISNFPRLLKNVASLVERGSLLILLDSIDQLEGTFRAYTCKWLPRICPQNVQIIVSTISDLHGILEWLKEILNDDSCFIEMKPLPEVTGIDILHHRMKDVQRKVTADQLNILKNAFKKFPQPLFLKLLFEEAKRWKSYTVVSEEQLAVRVDEAIWKLFERLEREFGVTLVSHALGYIVASRNGLTSEELLHVLSLDDEVLDEIYQYWPPPDPTEVAVPNLIWARLKFELEEYLVERQAEGKTVLVLYHRQFTMAATKRYIKDPISFQSRHQVLAEFFSGKWANLEKKLCLTQQGKTLNPFRKVPYQPLRFESEYNRRKLRQLPYHMTLSGTEFHGDLCKYIYGNFNFLDTYIKAFSTQQLIEEISFSLMSMDDSSNLKSQVMLLRDTLRLAKPSLEFVGNEQPLSIEILGRLGGQAESDEFRGCLQPLIEGARHSCDQSKDLQLIPMRACFPRPGGPLRSSLVGHSGGIQDLYVNSTSTLLATASADGTVRIWDINTDEMVHVLVARQCVICVQISPDNHWVVGVTQEGTIHVWSMKTGDLFHKILPEEQQSSQECLHLSISNDSSSVVYVSKGQVTVYSLKTGKLLSKWPSQEDLGDFSCADFDPYSEMVLGGTTKGTIWAWYIHNFSEMTSGPSEESLRYRVTHIKLSKKGTSMEVVYVTENGVLVFGEYSPTDGNNNPFQVIKVCSEEGLTSVSAICKSEITSQVWVACKSHILCFDSANSTKEAIYRLKGYTTPILSLVAVHQESFLIAGHCDDVMVIWSMGNSPLPELLGSMEGLNADVTHLLFADAGPDYKMLISASTKLPFIKIWNLTLVSSHLANNRTFFYKYGPMEVTPDGKYVIYQAPVLESYDQQFVMKIWNSETGQVSELEARKNFETCFTVADERYFFVGSQSGEIMKTNFETKEAEHILSSNIVGEVILMSFNQEKSILAFLQRTSQSCAASIWDLKLDQSHCVLNDVKEDVTCLLVTLNSTLLMAGDFGGVLICDARGKVTKLADRDHKPGYRTLALSLSSSERMLAVAPNTPKTDIWDWRASKVILTLRRSGVVQCLAFTKDDKYIITGSQDKKMKMFSLSDGVLLKDIYVYGSLVTLLTTSDKVLGGIELGHVLEFKLHEGSRTTERRKSSISRTCSLL